MEGKEKTGKWIIYIGAAAAILLGIFGYYQMNKTPSMQMATDQNATIKTITLGGATLQAEIADTPAKQTHGLSDRLSLASSSAMLFAFDKPERYEFWMKDMHFPLDMIWVDSNMKIIDISKNVPVDSFPDLIAPKIAAQYVIEVNAGYSDLNKIKIGDTLTIK